MVEGSRRKLIDLDRQCGNEPIAEPGKDKRTWRGSLGASIAPSIVALDPRGEARELVMK